MLKKLLSLALVGGLICVLAGCEQNTTLGAAQSAEQGQDDIYAELEGLACTIQFKRDLLGAARDLPVSPETNGINGAKVSISGKVIRADHDWVVIEQVNYHQSGNTKRSTWVPRENILLFTVVNR